MSETTQAGGLTDPLRNYNFAISVFDPAGDAHFTECSGLGVKVHTIRYREAGAQKIVRTLPGAVEYSDVILRYGLTAEGSSQLWQWLTDTITGNVARVRKTVSIIVYDPSNVQEVLRWNLRQAFPSEWSGAAFDAMGRQAAIEYLKLSYDDIERVPGSRTG